MKPFERLELILDGPCSPAVNMARDEALLQCAIRPVLRCYAWETPALSLGVFQSLAAASSDWPGLPTVRRPTAGGAVIHGNDFTYALVAPAEGRQKPSGRLLDSYATIHGVLCAALKACAGIDPLLASTEVASRAGGLCFDGPVRSDVLWRGRKIAGAAQRRTRAGLLHQGSIQGVDLPDGFGPEFARQLAGDVVQRDFEPRERTLAERLVAERYASRAWLLRHP